MKRFKYSLQKTFFPLLLDQKWSKNQGCAFTLPRSFVFQYKIIFLLDILQSFQKPTGGKELAALLPVSDFWFTQQNQQNQGLICSVLDSDSELRNLKLTLS